MRNRLLLLLSFIFPLSVFAVDVPENLDFAGMRLKIKDNVRQKIQADVDRLTKPSRYTESKLERVRLYFPIIERVLAEEGLPNEFKYLVIQESDLISDAVSTSNAVGFWQFKRETALEMGLTVNNDVDERKHIVAATRAAARYLKRNNFFFDNWLHALIAYNTGVTGAKPFVDESDRGANRMEITDNTHWYALKFLAHRVAFANATANGPLRPTLTLLEYPATGGQKLSDIANTLNVSEDDLAAYNKWLASRRIPDDKPYVVIAPVPADQADVVAARANVPKRQPVQFNYEYNYDVEADARQSGKYPDLKKRENGFYTINGKPGIQARTGDNAAALAARGEVSLDKFLKYNDLQPNDVIFPGQVYYLKKKRNKGKLHFHTYIKGQTLWQVSQKYGVKLKALRTKNRIAEGEQLQHGRVLWLRFRRPADKPVEIRNVPKPGAKTPAQTVIAKKGLGSETETMTKQPPVTDAGGQIPEKPRTVPVPTQTAPVQPKVDTTRPVANPPVTEPAPPPVKTEEPIQIPAKTEGMVSVQSHRVQAGETLFGIARQYGATVARLRQWNNLAETDGISVGQQLTVGEGKSTSADTGTVSPKPTQPITTPSAAAKPPVQPTTDGAAQQHTVQAGETLFSIAKRYGATVADLRHWNNLTETDGVKIGQVLVVTQPTAKPASADSTRPSPASPVGTVIEYTAQPGDTLYKIARAHGVTVAQLLEWNGKSSPAVSVGEKVKIRK